MINAAFRAAFKHLKERTTAEAPGTSPLDATPEPFLDFDPTTNRVILYADQAFYDETWAKASNLLEVQIYFNERLYDLFIGLPYEYVSITGELNYRLRVMYNNSNLVPKNVLTLSTSSAPIPLKIQLCTDEPRSI